MTNRVTDIERTPPPFGPDEVDVTPLYLSITERWTDSGSSHNIHLVYNGDIDVILDRGQRETRGDHIPCRDLEASLVIVLGVDGGDHDEIHFTGLNKARHRGDPGPGDRSSPRQLAGVQAGAGELAPTTRQDDRPGRIRLC